MLSRFVIVFLPRSKRLLISWLQSQSVILEPEQRNSVTASTFSYFRPDKEKEIFAIMQEGVELRNELYHKANNPVEPKNASLVRKYYAAFRNEMVEGYGKLFEKLSALHD